jgi:TolA-binding protein
VQDRASGREELGLDGGYVYVDVPKLRPGHFFGIRTPDTQVTVHGTSFSVEVSEPRFGSVSTSVSVTDGVVTVQRAGEPEIFLTAGTRWVSTVAAASASTAPSASAEIHAAPTVPRASLDVSRAKTPVVGPDAHSGSSVGQTRLAEQNRLFADAMTARDRGDDAVAIQMLEGFIRQFPACPLTEDAHVELFRAFVHRGDRGEAARIARQYLAVYSDGFARDEARVLALEPVAPPLP